MFFQFSPNSLADEQQQFVGPPISPLLCGQALQAAAAMNIANSSLISPFYQPLGQLSPALFMPSLLGGSPGPFMNNLINAISSGPAQHRKLFIGGIHHETSDEQLRDYYSQWGQVVDCIVIRDPVSRQSRGFGFVTFATTEMADAAMADRPHTIGGKIVDPKRAIPREQMLQTAHCSPAFLEVEPSSECKLLLLGIDGFHTVDVLRHYFERFGDLEQVEIVGHSGFGFIVYEEKSGMQKCMAQGKFHLIKGRKVEIRQADRENNNVKNSEFLSSLRLSFPHHSSRTHRKRVGGRVKSGNSVGSHESQSHSPESTQSEKENSN